jgi:hypothetical protein
MFDQTAKLSGLLEADIAIYAICELKDLTIIAHTSIIA